MSARRLRDRTGGGASNDVTLKPSKTLTPVSSSNKRSSSDPSSKIPSAGKENPRSTSKAPAVTQKPLLRAVPRVNKAAAIAVGEGETRVRWSTSSVPRGRSSSPSDFSRVSADARRERRVSVDRSGRGSVSEIDRSVLGEGRSSSAVRGHERDKQKIVRDAGVMASGGGVTGLRIFKELKENVKLGVNKDKRTRVSEAKRPADEEVNYGNSLGVKVLGNLSVEDNLSSRLINLKDPDVGKASRADDNDKILVVSERVQMSLEVNEVKDSQGVESSLESTKKFDQKDLEVSKDCVPSGEGTENSAGNKYPSKLHEKLAFLEGKVKRIASDIKKTKEMLDLNNPASSKMILSDIQEKISGIEEAMGHGTLNSDGKSGLMSRNQRDIQMVLKDGNDEEDNNRASAKGLSNKELEDRLFPHHKLLKNRMSMKSTSGTSQSNELHAAEPSYKVKDEDLSLCPIDNNPIALEFLASLNSEQTKVTTRSEQAGLEVCDVQETDGNTSAGIKDSSNLFKDKQDMEIVLTTDEILDEFHDQENKQGALICEEIDDAGTYQLNGIGFKTSTGGWFVSEGEAVLLAHSDNSCSFYDITNLEEKTVYKSPAGISPNIWRDCWIIRAPGADGCSGRYVVAASAGNTMDAGFCSWDFYSKDIQALQIEGGVTFSRTALAPLPNTIGHRRNAPSNMMVPETEQWWYKPCGPLIVSTATCQKTVKVYDVRDSEEVMDWEVQKPVSVMDYSSPLQWRNRGKVVLAETDAISQWDVTSISSQALLSVSLSGRKISALHINNTDAELGGGVRQRVSSSEAEGNDGVFCTTDSINILDFREPSGIGLKLPKAGLGAKSVFCRGDSIYVGCSISRSGGKKQASSVVHQFSLRKQGPLGTYALPENNAHAHHTAITQVWGNSNLVLAVCGLGLFVFDALKDEGLNSSLADNVTSQVAREVVGPDDLYAPSFDYSASRALLISRDRPASWKQIS